MSLYEHRLRLQRVAEAASKRSSDSTRHKCFISYRADDMDEVEEFVDDYGSEFIPRSVGVTVEDDFIASDDEEYIKRRIRELYLADSTVTLVLLGACTWSRKFVDWEISSSLRNDQQNKRNGLLAIALPSTNNSAKLPTRVNDNWNEEDEAEGYALYRRYPTSNAELRGAIDEAFDARAARSELVDNTRTLMKNNRSC
jgi:Thoeris protein ThsB, TIR-like domain